MMRRRNPLWGGRPLGDPRRFRIPTCIFAAGFILFAGAPTLATEHEPPEISAGAAMNRLLKSRRIQVPVAVPEAEAPPEDMPGFRQRVNPLGFAPGQGFDDFSFLDNSSENDGFLFIPPDPIGAAGMDRLVSVVNVAVVCREKNGAFLWREGLQDFFAPLAGSSLGTYTFDPKVVYDHYENRFIVVALEQTAAADGDPADASRILIAVSKDGLPQSATSTDWYFHAIDSEIRVSGNDYWADYPGLEVDEEAIYITANMFRFSGLGSQLVRLWIVHKGVVGGLYGGGAATVTLHNPIGAGASVTTTMPALIFGAGGVGPGIGTFLVGYDGLTAGGAGGAEYVQVIRVNNPLTSPSFTNEQVAVGNIEDIGGIFGFPVLPDAPQPVSAILIEVNNRRALDAVWRNGSLWITTTINPNATSDPVNAGQTTARWFRLNTSAVTSSASPAGLITSADGGNLGGEDLAAGAYTYFPAIGVNGSGQAMFGFSASATSVYAGAYMAGREATQAPGTVGPTLTVKAGQDYYVRRFGDTRNRWGDYSGVAVDPADDRVFWVYNEFAMIRGTVISGEDGRWRTAWRAAAIPCLSVACPDDTTGPGGGSISLDFCVANCGPLSHDITYSLTDTQGWITPASATVTVAAGNSFCLPRTVVLPSDACPPDHTVVRWIASSPAGIADTCEVRVDAMPCPSGPVLEVAPASIVFPTVAAGDTACRTVVVRNAGDAVLTVSSVTGCDSSGFALDTSSLAGSVAPGDSTAFVVCFTPVAADPESCTVTVVTPDSTALIPVSVGAVTAVAADRPRAERVLVRVSPNPFQGASRILFTLPIAGRVHVVVYNAEGRRVRTLLEEERGAGNHEVVWDGRDARGHATTGGIYFIRVETPGGEAVIRSVRVR